MTSRHDSKNHNGKPDIKALLARIDYLEELDRWHLFALDLLLSLREVHNDVRHGRNPAVILGGTREYLGRLMAWKNMAFLTVNEDDANFLLFDCAPEEDWEWIQREIDHLIGTGEFAWALNQNREVVLNAQERDCPLVLHVLTTKSRIRGMFVGVPAAPLESLQEGCLHLLSIVLHHTAYVLESAELYRLLSEENEALEAKIAERTAELQYQHTHDALTGLPNRVVLVDRISQAIRHAQHRGRSVALLMLDIDAFKLVNDTLGRANGDALLKEIAQRLHQRLREGEDAKRVDLDESTVSRLGSDEFCVLIPNLEDLDDILHAVQTIQQVIGQPVVLDDQIFYPTCAVGISVYPEDGENPETLLTQADIAMHHAKARGKSIHQFYTPKMNAQALSHLTLANELRRALEQEEFLLYYQPQVDIAKGRVAGVEALIRWQKPGQGLVSPMEFIPLLEEDSSLILPVGDWVLREACRCVKRLRAGGFPELRVAVNLSANQFLDEELAQRIAGILRAEGVTGEAIELELTERTLMNDVPRAISTLETLNALGLRLAVDDFGTGYSSLSYLKRFPINTLKVDRSFVKDTPDSAEDSAIVRAIIAMADSLGQEVVAEGAETAEQVSFLKGLECRYVQGFYFSKPLPEDQLTP